ncbi:MAG TPA: SLC13 family permease [Methylomirabilota bacterium]|nr:SLC13 family permease [Methylomirabilota bacterium]
MTFEIGLLLFLTLACVVLFSTERISPDVTALMLVLALVFTKLLKPEVAFRGFGSETVIMILGLLILTAALLRTGVVDLVGGKILRFTGKSPMRIMIVVMIASALLGAFMSNTASTAFFVPVVMGLAKRAKISPRQLLLPLAFSSILTSSVTLISTSTNIVVSGLMQQYQLEPMGMFELAPVGIPILLAGLVYMTVVGRFWLIRPADTASTGPERGLRAYFSEVVVLPNSKLVGRTLAESGFGHDFDFIVLRILRKSAPTLAPRADTVVQAGDILLVEGAPDELLKVKDTAGVEIKADLKHGDPSLPEEDLGIVEVILLPKSPLLARTLKGIGFRERYGLQVLGISRHGKILHRKVSELPLRMGDILLIQGPKSEIALLEADRTFRVIETLAERQPKRRRAPMAIAIFVGVLALATFKVVPFSVAVILGSVAAFLTKCITPDEAYRELEWKAVILIGSMLALGAAMEQTGAARYLAGLIVNLAGGHGPTWLLAGFFALTVALTQPMSNQAAAVVVLPIAIQTAIQLGLNPRSFAMMVALAASCSYLTPLEPSCLMVYGPGGYKFSDFLKVGSVLTIIIGTIAVVLVPRVWPL